MYKTKPYAHQARAMELSRHAENFALLMDTGTGKSWVAVNTAAEQFRAGMIDQLIVLAPNGPHRDWPEHCASHMPEDVPHTAAFFQSSYKNADYRAALKVARRGELRVLSFNIEAVAKSADTTILLRELMKERRTLLVVDESQRIRTPKAKRTRACQLLGKYATSRRIMSGSTVIKGLENLYAPYAFLDRGIIGQPTFKQFKERYCTMVGQFNKIVGYQNVPELMERIDPHTFQVLAEDCLDLPEKRFVHHQVELSPVQRQYYNNLRKSFLIELEGGGILSVEHVMTRMLRLQQILCGHAQDDAGNLTELPCPRLEILGDLVEGTTDKCIVWARFQPDVRRIFEELKSRGLKCETYFGPMSEEQRASALSRWRQDPRSTLIATPQTGGVGLTLNEAGTAIYFANSFNYEHRKQSMARNWRIGQTKPVTYHDLLVPGSLDVRAMNVLEQRANTSLLLTDRREMRNWLAEAI